MKEERFTMLFKPERRLAIAPSFAIKSKEDKMKNCGISLFEKCRALSSSQEAWGVNWRADNSEKIYAVRPGHGYRSINNIGDGLVASIFESAASEVPQFISPETSFIKVINRESLKNQAVS